LSQLIITSLLVLALGSHWALVQSVAWVRMAVEYSRSAPLGEALGMTFDGRHPCTLCKIVQAATHSERQKTSVSPDTKLDLLCRFPGLLLFPDPCLPPLLGMEEQASTRLEAPPTPPPESPERSLSLL
jgi:hypothetical protein